MARKWSVRSVIHRALNASPASPQHGEDVKALQAAINQRAAARGMRRVTVDGVFDGDTLKATLAIGHALGALDSTVRKGQGTIGLQRMIRYPTLRTPAQLRRAKDRKPRPATVVYPIDPRSLIADTWGYHPGVHDGVDLICPPNQPVRAMVKSQVVRADAGGWWGKGAPADPAAKAKGDGIIILRALETVGPIKQGMNICYGHAERATVMVGQTVSAGHVVGKAGLANAWHLHVMVNGRSDTKGVGDRDPKPILDYAKEKNA